MLDNQMTVLIPIGEYVFICVISYMLADLAGLCLL